MSTPLVPCLYTTVKNISGAERVFGFLGEHGKKLAANEEYTEFGDIVAKLTKTGPQNKRRKRLAFEQALAGFTRGDGRVIAKALHIKATPAVILYDTGASTPKTFTLVSGTLGTADPCYGSGY